MDSRCQCLVEFFKQANETGAKKLVCLAAPAVLIEGREIEIIRLDGQAGGDMVADESEPRVLVGSEDLARCFFHC